MKHAVSMGDSRERKLRRAQLARLLIALGALACAPAEPARAPHAVILPAASAPKADPPSAAPKGRPPPAPPFVFVEGKPADLLGPYAERYWGPNGRAVFENPATVRVADVADEAGAERLIAVGRYAVVEVPARNGFYARDLGERGFTIAITPRDVFGANVDYVELRYTLRDEGESADWKAWQETRAEPPIVHSVTHSVIELWAFRPGEPERMFVHEYETWANCCGSEVTRAPPRVRNEVSIFAGRISVKAREAWRANASTFRPRALDGIPPALVPWAVTERLFTFDGNGFVAQDDVRPRHE